MKKIKLGIISDTHFPERANSINWQKIEEVFRGADTILHAGDLVSLSVVDKLKKIAPVEAVCGNMDGYEVAKSLPHKKVLQFNGVRIGLIHGFAGNNEESGLMSFFAGENIKILVYGHTHVAKNKYKQAHLCFNPGSPVKSHSNTHETLGIIEISEDGKIESKLFFHKLAFA